MAGFQIEFSEKKFPFYSLENGRIGTLGFPQLYGARCLCLRLKYFSSLNLPIGLMAGFHIEFSEKKVPF
jgi:hypothetical protein